MLRDTPRRMDSLEASVVLNMLPGMGPVRLRALLARFGSPEAVLSAGEGSLREVPGVGDEVAGAIRDWRRHVDLDDEMALAGRLGVRILTRDDAEYPAHLREIHAPPIILYCLGRLEDRDRHALGIVGTRAPTHYGMDCAKRLAYQIAYAGMTVFSGLARGVDTLAHTAALAAKGRTVAVVGCGLAGIYPPENDELARRIADGQGAVLSEFPLRRKPDRQTFPMRNRIIAGASLGLLVVECGRNSGALITASQAVEQGRSVYAVPGPINRPSSEGCNRLIQQGARLVTSAAEILDEVHTLFPRQARDLAPSRPAVSLSDEESAVYQALGDEETPIDEVVRKSGLPIPSVSSTLLRLEMRRLVKQRPGGLFVRLL